MLERLGAAVVLLAAPVILAQTGPQVLTFPSSVDPAQQQYAVYIPKNFDAAKRYPLLVSLHSEDSTHRLNLAQILIEPSRFGLFGPDAGRFPPLRDTDFIVACPLARGSMGYQGIPEQDVYDMLADVERRFPVDPDRVYLTGISMGGGGALWLAMTHPDVWAGVAALCPDAIPGTDELAPNLLDLPVRLFHGEQDPIVPVASSRAWQRKLWDAGVPAGYQEYPAVRHNVWDIAYRPGAVLDWFASLRRDPYPERVRLVTRSYRYGSAYWVRIDGLTPGVLASVDAKRAGTEVQIETKNVDGLTVTSQGPALPTQVSIDGALIRVRPAAKLSFLKTANGWRAGLFPLTGKRPGAEGPIVEAVSARHIYVYGSLGARSADELEARRKTAETAAAWSTARDHLSLTLAVKADADVTQADMDGADLVLFGTSETNLVIRHFAGNLPLALSPDAADYGLLFISPVGKHYALISSGLPWWIGADEAARGGYALAPPQYRLLSTFGDYVLFRGTLAHVVAEGRFDRNWKVPADAAPRLSVTGTITIR
ncbi:MAG TPA: alpha/beta hydrolase-fold protein [Bryobacteraceae bacterium]|nr:alpha/beta hydrolase-fold protein [Bryobacteraceae bacterium]